MKFQPKFCNRATVYLSIPISVDAGVLTFDCACMFQFLVHLGSPFVFVLCVFGMCVCPCVFYTRSDQIVDAIIISTQIAMKQAKHVSVSAHNRVSVYCKK